MREMLRAFYMLASAVMLAIGVWMLAAPASWFHHFPDALPDTGPFNHHLVRDLGGAFAVMGVGLAWCARAPRHRRAVHLGVTAFLVAHALVHLGELLGGSLPHR